MDVNKKGVTMRNKDDIKTVIVVAIVCIFCLIIGLVLSIKSNTDKLEAVSEYNVFFSNVSYVNNYINCVADKDADCVYNLLNEEYLKSNNISVDRVLENIYDYPSGSSIKVLNMDYVKIKDNFVYYINGMIYKNSYDDNVLVSDDFSIILIKDYDNLGYSLYPVTSKNYKKILNRIKDINVVKNEHNVIANSSLINSEQVCIIYLSDFINTLFTDVNNSYASLSTEMKKIYNNIDVYREYVNDNKNKFSTVADKCKLDMNGSNRVYTVIDNEGNSYIFDEESVMKYKVDFYLKEVIN